MTNRFIRYGGLAFGVVLASVLVVAAAPSPARAQQTLDHFKCYLIDKFEPHIEAVLLRDQFDNAVGRTEEAVAFDAIRFCNPVTKRFRGEITDIININNHLTFYHYERPDFIPELSGVVVVRNQFGQQQAMRYRSADILAVPTEKQEPGIGPPDNLDHFKCYFTSAQDLQDLVVGLKDQFVRTRHKVGKARLFCNPVQKTDAAGNVFRIQNPDEHLTCYRISAGTAAPRDLVIANQFTSPTTDIVTGRDNLVCLPSRKLFFTVD